MGEISERLLPCPFCSGEPELDYSRYFRAMTSGNLEKAVAIYCLECSADMTLCRSDHPGYDEEQLASILMENWNRRAARTAQFLCTEDGEFNGNEEGDLSDE